MVKINKSNKLLMSVKPVLKAMTQASLQNNNRPSVATIQQRESLIIYELGHLYRSKYKLKKIDNIKPKHFEYLLNIWYASDIKLKTLEAKISWFTLMFKTIGKRGLAQEVLYKKPIPEIGIKGTYKKLIKPEFSEGFNKIFHVEFKNVR